MRASSNLFVLISFLVFSGPILARENRCNHLFYQLPIKFNPGGKNISPSAEIRDPENPEFHAIATVSIQPKDRVFLITINTKNKTNQRTKFFSGKQSLQRLHQYMLDKEFNFNKFVGIWQDSHQGIFHPSDNLVQFLRYYKEGVNELEKNHQLNDFNIQNETQLLKLGIVAEKAAWKTWTGKQVKQLGYKYIESVAFIYSPQLVGVDKQMGAIQVEVYWSKKRPKNGFRFIDNYGDDSAIPRFHYLIENYLP